MSKRYNGKSFKDSSVMKKAKLSFKEKLQVLENFKGLNVKVDISGGDPLVVSEGYELLKAASECLSSDNVTLTATGVGLSKYKVEIYIFILLSLTSISWQLLQLVVKFYTLTYLPETIYIQGVIVFLSFFFL